MARTCWIAFKFLNNVIYIIYIIWHRPNASLFFNKPLRTTSIRGLWMEVDWTVFAKNLGIRGNSLCGGV